jgi:hypothetical protein
VHAKCGYDALYAKEVVQETVRRHSFGAPVDKVSRCGFCGAERQYVKGAATFRKRAGVEWTLDRPSCNDPKQSGIFDERLAEGEADVLEPPEVSATVRSGGPPESRGGVQAHAHQSLPGSGRQVGFDHGVHRGIFAEQQVGDEGAQDIVAVALSAFRGAEIVAVPSPFLGDPSSYVHLDMVKDHAWTVDCQFRGRTVFLFAFEAAVSRLAPKLSAVQRRASFFQETTMNLYRAGELAATWEKRGLNRWVETFRRLDAFRD